MQIGRFYISRFMFSLLLWLVLMVAMTSCSSTKHVPQGKYLLDNVSIKVEGTKDLKPESMYPYLRQVQNHKVLGGMKLQLMVYNISGRDSTSRFNRWIRKIGAPPVIYDSILTEASVNQLTRAMQNMGYMHAYVKVDTLARPEKKKMRVNYTLYPGKLYYISSLSYNIPDDSIKKIVMNDTLALPLKVNAPFDRSQLEAERQMITQRLRNRGYYSFNKEYVTFMADTAANSNDVNLVLNVRPPLGTSDVMRDGKHHPYYVRNVVFVTNYDAVKMRNSSEYVAADTIHYRSGFDVYYDEKYLRPSALDDCCFIEPNKMYRAINTDKTYQALQRLGIIRSVNISYEVVGVVDDKVWLDAFVLLSKDKSQSRSLTLEGTNSSGDLGFGVGVTYQHRNLAKGSEALNARFKVSYESISGDLSGFINHNYTEYTGDVGITFPKFMFPFLKKSFRQRVLASTEFSLSGSYQQRPEYTRVIAGIGWKYHWSQGNKKYNRRHILDLLDIYYVNLPKSNIKFIEEIKNPLLRYSYENHFIMRSAYTFYKSNKKTGIEARSIFQPNIYTIRVSGEIAGNLLYGISKLFNIRKDENNTYKILGISYSQYFKADADYSLTHKFSPRHGISFHVGAGIGVPYGNSSILPFEKRFYSGGANSVRGWNVRSLGPGAYISDNKVSNFINQCGDIRLDLSLEYRVKAFWVIELAAFIDAGNIWTIHDYENQPGGLFKFNTFYKQLAGAYGFGLRLDFTYFLLRFDLGMKAHNPAMGEDPWPLIRPKWSRDHTFHFSIGYPF